VNEINDNIVNTEGEKIIDECKYHLCTKKNIEVQTCPYCNKHYCVDHINPKIPMQPNFDDSKQIGEWKEGENYYHPCPDYYDYVQKQEKNKERSISHSIDTMPRGRVSYRIFKKSSDYGHIRDETPKLIRKEQQTSDTTKHIDKPYFVPSDNRSMSFEKPLPKTEHTTNDDFPKRRGNQSYRRGLKINYRLPYNIHLSNLATIFYGSLIIFLILHLILMVVSSKELWIIYIVVLSVAEITGLIWLLFKLDHLSTHTTLRIWGLRILAGLIGFFGVFLLILIWISSFSYAMFYPLYPKLDPSITFLSFLPYLIPGIGLSGIGAYLEFKFRRESGVIVYRG